MKYYAVAEIDVTNPGWIEDYVTNVTRLVEQHGGRYLARTSRVEKVEGDRGLPQILLIIEWPSREAAESFYNSDEYRPQHDRRSAGASNELVLVAGEDVSNAAIPRSTRPRVWPDRDR
jgi:uncharacterized protein (DUF1330 family)